MKKPARWSPGMRRLLKSSLPWLAGLLLAPALAGPTIDLSAEASRPAANDLVKAMVYAEANGSEPAEVARRVNQEIAEALRLIKSKAAVTVKSGHQHTYPVYGNNRRIEGWRMHAELLLESKEITTLSELLGRLQQMKLALGNVSQSPAEATRRDVEEAATRDAIQAFERRATVVASALGKTYRLRQLSIQQAGSQPPVMPMRAMRAMAMNDAAPLPVEAGESLLTVSVSGQIELVD